MNCPKCGGTVYPSDSTCMNSGQALSRQTPAKAARPAGRQRPNAQPGSRAGASKSAPKGMGTAKLLIIGVVAVLAALGLWKYLAYKGEAQLNGVWSGSDGSKLMIRTLSNPAMSIAVPGSDFGEGSGSYTITAGVGGLPLAFEGSFDVTRARYLGQGQTADITSMVSGGQVTNSATDEALAEFSGVKLSSGPEGAKTLTTGDTGSLTIRQIFHGEKNEESLVEFTGNVHGAEKLILKVGKGGDSLEVSGTRQGTFTRKSGGGLFQWLSNPDWDAEM